MFETQGRLPWLNQGNGDGGEGAEELGKQTLALMEELHLEQRFLSFYLMWAEDITVSAESGLTFSMGLGCLTSAILDLWMVACARSIPKAISSPISKSFPFSRH